jgi:hypothetical protein
MCEPITIASLAVTALSTGLSMYGQYQAGKAQEAGAKASADYNAQTAANEAATQQQLAQNEIAKGAADRERQQRQAARAMGEMRANMGASGFEMDSGSNLSLLAESAAEHQYDSNIINQNAAAAAWQHQTAAASALNQQGLAEWQYANASSGRTATGLSMAGSLLSGIGAGIGQYNDWAKLQPSGVKEKKAAIK